MKTFGELNIGDSVFMLDESDDQMDELFVTGDYTDTDHTIEVADGYGDKTRIFVGDDDTESYYQNILWFSDKEALFDYLEHQIDRYKNLMKTLALH